MGPARAPRRPRRRAPGAGRARRPGPPRSPSPSGDDLAWLLQAARGGPSRPSRATARPDVLDALRRAARCFRAELRAADRAAPRPRWRRRCGTSWPAACVTADGFRPCARCSRPARAWQRRRRQARRRLAAAGAPAVGSRTARAGGRCCPSPRPTEDPDELAEAVAGQLAGPLGRRVPGPAGPREPGRCPGARSCGPCAGSRPGARSAAAGSSPGSPASSTRSPRPSTSCAGSAEAPPQRRDGPADRRRPAQPGRHRPARPAVPAVTTNTVTYPDGALTEEEAWTATGTQ